MHKFLDCRFFNFWLNLLGKIRNSDVFCFYLQITGLIIDKFFFLDAVNVISRRFKMFTRQNNNAHFQSGFNLLNGVTLFV